MKKYLLLLATLFLYTNAFGAPSNTLSIIPVAVDGATITASDENSRNNVVVSTYNAHTHTDISQTGNTLNVGDALAGDKTITAYNADSNKPYIKYDDTNNYWIISTNGTAPSVMLFDNGITFEGTTNDANETTLNITNPTADRTITFPDQSGNVALTSGSTFSDVNIDGGTIDGTTIGASSKKDGTFINVTLDKLTATGSLDIGSGNLRAHTLTSDAVNGTIPFYVTSQTLATNFNADFLDGYHATNFTQRQLFTSNGTFTVPTGITKVYITAVGGGGGGGGGSGSTGGGGGGGGMVIKYPFTVTAGDSHTVTIGGGGAGGLTSGGTNGTAGTNTTFNTTVIALGGGLGYGSSGASVSGVGAGGLDGAANNYNMKGGNGVNTTNTAYGGGTIFGAGAACTVAGVANTGGGGGGGSDGSNAGAGGSGMMIVEW